MNTDNELKVFAENVAYLRKNTVIPEEKWRSC